jgi:hypothetical protein
VRELVVLRLVRMVVVVVVMAVAVVKAEALLYLTSLMVCL